MRVARLFLLIALLLATGTITKAQDAADDALVVIGRRFYKYAKVKTIRVSTGDASPDNDGQVDRDLRLIPMASRKGLRNAEHLIASPTQRFLILDWKYCVGVNGMALYERVGVPRHSGNLRYRLLVPNLTSRIAHGAEKDGEKERTNSGLFLVVRAWHGTSDRYLDFVEHAPHSPQEVARGSYDTRTGRVAVISSAKTRSSGHKMKMSNASSGFDQTMSAARNHEGAYLPGTTYLVDAPHGFSLNLSASRAS